METRKLADVTFEEFQRIILAACKEILTISSVELPDQIRQGAVDVVNGDGTLMHEMYDEFIEADINVPSMIVCAMATANMSDERIAQFVRTNADSIVFALTNK